MIGPMTTSPGLPSTALPAIDSATEAIHSAEDMAQRWRALMGPLGFGERLLWLGFVGADRCMLKTLSQVPVGATPNRGMIENLMLGLEALLEELDPGTSVALLLTRPGRDGVSAQDLHWATVLADTAARIGIPIEPIFRGNDAAIKPV